MAYKAVIWDLDGTLVESLPGIAEAANLALEKHGFPTHPQNSIRNFIGDGTWMLIRRAIADVPDTTIDQVNTSFKQIYADVWKQGTEIFEGILPLLTKCKNAGIYNIILSNKPHEFTVTIVEALFSTIAFDLVMGQQIEIEKKPSPQGTLMCLEKIQLKPEKVVFVGDSTVDLQTAKAAGVKSAAVTWGYHNAECLKTEGADHFASTIQELNEIIFY